jgi:glycosyltransferase involved in cell wall biosynthesis
MKICMLAERLPPAFGGAVQQAFALARHLRATGHGVFFAGAQLTPDAPATDCVDGFPVYRVPYAVSGKLTKLRSLLGYARVFWRQRRAFDVLHLHGAYYVTLTAAVFARCVLGKPFLVKLTSINMDPPSAIRARRYGRWSLWCYRRAAAIVCMSTAQWEDCRAHHLPAARLHLIPNGVALDQFCPPATPQERAATLAKLGLAADRRYVVFIGTLEAGKGVEVLVGAAVQLCGAVADVDFLLIGPDGRGPGEGNVRGAYVQGLRDQIAGAGLDERIRLLGRQANVADYLRGATLFAFPSVTEGFGTVLIEAMASGVPPVAQGIAGVTTDIITAGVNGVILTEATASAWAAALGQLLNDPARMARLGRAARQTVEEKFAMPVIAKRYADLYQQFGTS